MKEKLMTDLKEAMKNKDIIRKNTIQLIRASILQIEKDKKIELDNPAIMELIAKQVKDRDKAIGMVMTDPAATDFIERTCMEIEILKEYLPKELTQAELEALVATTAAELNITEIKQMGQLIKAVKIQAVAADGKLISELVKNYLKK